MRKFLVSMAIMLMAVSASAQNYTNEDGTYDVYCDVMGYNFWGAGKIKALIDLGAVSAGHKFESIYENGQKKKFNTMIEVLDYMARRGWKVQSTYVAAESQGLRGQQNVIHYLLIKKVKSDEEIRAGLDTKEDD